MAEIVLRYMTVSVDIQPDGMNMSCWMAVEEFFAVEVVQFPHKYTAMGDSCTWLIHSNEELTIKMIALIGEYADRICQEQITINAKRKLGNR